MSASIKQWIKPFGAQGRSSKRKLSHLLRFLAVYLLAIPITLAAQAAVEYALKSGGSVAAASVGSATVAGCRLDSALPACLSRAYPQATIVVVVVVCLLIMRWLAGFTGKRAH